MYNHLDSLRQWALAHNTLYIVTFDESYDSDPANQILTIFFGPMVKGGMYSENVNLYNLLRTIEDMYGLGYAGSASTATTITDCWQNDTAVIISTGVNNFATTDYSFQVVPNPASQIVTFKSSQAINEPASLTITDAIGHYVGKYTFNGTDLQLTTTQYAAGIYYYKVATNHSVLGDGKFVINHN
jgi:hypothetical protein